MADERVVAQLVVEGAQKAVREIQSVASATSDLVRVQESVGVRQRRVYDSVAQAAEESARRQEQAARKAEQAAAQIAAQVAQQTVAGNLETIRSSGGNVARFADTSLASRQAQALAAAQRVAAASTNRWQQALNVLGSTLSRVTSIQRQATVTTQQHGAAINQSSRAQGGAQARGVTYLSTLSAIHAASFLLSNSTFTTAGSIGVLGAAFSKLGPVAVGAGVALGGILIFANQVGQAAARLQQILVGLVVTLAQFAVAATAALGAAGAAGVKLAADVEQGLALIQAIEAASREQLGRLLGESQRLALEFGVGVKEVVDAASLFSRAGGDIESAINGATEAIIKLQIASAGEIQAAEAARAVAVGLKAFAEEGATAIQIADAITAANQRSALTFTEVTQALQQAVPGSVTLGIQLADLTAIIVTLGNELKGTVAGTSFKQFLLDLVNPSKQAQDQLAKLGVTIKDVDGNARNIINVIDDLSKAVAGLPTAERAQALGRIFEARAGLAGNILSRESADSLRALRDELSALTASDVVDTLLLPLNAQLKRLQVTVEEVGRTFGAVLLPVIRQVVVGAIDFFQKLIPLAELAGQAVAVVLTNQGFGALAQRIEEITGNTQLANFLIELVNLFRNVRSAIVDLVVPAVQDFVSGLASLATEEGTVERVSGAFENANRTIRNVAVAVAAAIGVIKNLVVEFVLAEGTGGKLRDVLSTIATTVIANLVSGFVSLIPAIATAIAAMPIFARVTILVAQVTIRLIGLFKELELKFIDIAELAAKFGPVTSIATRDETGISEEQLNEQIELFKQIGDRAKEMREKTAKAFDFTALQQEIDNFSGTVDGLTGRLTALSTGVPEGAEEALNQATQAAIDANEAAEEALLQARLLGTEAAAEYAAQLVEASKAADEALTLAERNFRGFVGVFEDTGGKLSDALGNMIEEIQRRLAEVRQEQEDNPADINLGIDDKQINSTLERIREAGRDISRQLTNLAEDTSERVASLVERGTERIGDIVQKTIDDLGKLQRDVDDRIQDLRDSFTQRRLDRARTDDLQKLLDDELQVQTRHLEDTERAEERALEDRRRLRSRDTEDVQRNFDLQQTIAERVYSRAQQAAENAFRNIQRIRERALDQSLSAEERALSQRQRAEQDARREQQQISGATTPEERRRVQEQITAAREERQFTLRQENQTEALRKRHDDIRASRQQQQEQESQAFRQRQEDAQFQNRLRQEVTALAFRHRLEDIEHVQRREEEDATLQRRMDNERTLQALRETHQRRLRNLQDTLEEESLRRRERQVIRDAQDRANDIVRQATRSLGEVNDQLEQQLRDQDRQVDRSIRNAIQRLQDLEDSIPADVLGTVISELLETRLAVSQQSQEVLDAIGRETDKARAVLQAESITGETRIRLQTPEGQELERSLVRQIPSQVIAAQTLVATNLVLPATFSALLADGVYRGLVLAQERGVRLTVQDTRAFDTLINSLRVPLDSITRYFGR